MTSNQPATAVARDVTPEVAVISSADLAPQVDADYHDAAEQISAFEQILANFEQSQLTERDKGTAFEYLVREAFTQAQPWCEQFVKVQTYREWAHEHPELSPTARDTGIDLVATNRVLPDSDALESSLENISHGGGKLIN